MEQPPSPLPTPRALLTSLLHALSTAPPNPSSTTTTNPLKSLTRTHKPLLTTLHALFPGILLPALDLLDRHLITHITSSPTSTSLYLVRSTSGLTYAVRLRAWNCSCAAFAFAAFPTGQMDLPVCKHLLACALVDAWMAGLGGYVEERRVGREEMAGIAAG